ncbi:TPA: 50S ribosomal protein L35 [Candidatus Bathyarchaeota archaeon]|nr:50S ribosomal protein L35 [Candidatus Bathyarchaeota archaeon]
MPKVKTKKTVKERFRVTKTGKVLHKRGSISHRTSKERSSAKSRRGRVQQLSKTEVRRVRRMLGK